MEMQNVFTLYKEAAKHRLGHTDIDKSPTDETPKRDVLHPTQFAQLNQKM